MRQKCDDDVNKVTEDALPSELKANIERLKRLHEQGYSINDDIENSVDFKNPYLLEKVMKIFDIDGYSSNMRKDIYDPSYYIHLANAADEEATIIENSSKKEDCAPVKKAQCGTRGSKDRSGWSS